MTDNEIIKALECCMYGHECEGCPYIGKGLCSDKMKKDALDLINRQKAEIINRTEEYNDMLEQRNKVEEALEVMAMDVNSLTSERDALNEMVAELRAEIERLQKRNKTLTDISKNYDWKFAKAKSEAIKEFAERLKQEIQESKYRFNDSPYARACNQVADWCIEVSKELVKEMTEVSDEQH